jgi:hypothetical protein
MKNIFTIITLTAIVFFSSCATIFTGTSQTVQVNSVPSGAKVQVDGIDRGTTPAALKLKKGSDGQTVTLKMEGYETKTFQPETSFNGVAVLNLFSLLGWGIDAVTGAIYKYSPKYYEIELEKK